jgi:hypothetical protein
MKSVRLSSLIVCNCEDVVTEGWVIENMGGVLTNSRGTHVYHLDNGNSRNV